MTWISHPGFPSFVRWVTGANCLGDALPFALPRLSEAPYMRKTHTGPLPLCQYIDASVNNSVVKTTLCCVARGYCILLSRYPKNGELVKLIAQKNHRTAVVAVSSLTLSMHEHSDDVKHLAEPLQDYRSCAALAQVGGIGIDFPLGRTTGSGKSADLIWLRRIW